MPPILKQQSSVEPLSIKEIKDKTDLFISEVNELTDNFNTLFNKNGNHKNKNGPLDKVMEALYNDVKNHKLPKFYETINTLSQQMEHYKDEITMQINDGKTLNKYVDVTNIIGYKFIQRNDLTNYKLTEVFFEKISKNLWIKKDDTDEDGNPEPSYWVNNFNLELKNFTGKDENDKDLIIYKSEPDADSKPVQDSTPKTTTLPSTKSSSWWRMWPKRGGGKQSIRKNRLSRRNKKSNKRTLRKHRK